MSTDEINVIRNQKYMIMKYVEGSADLKSLLVNIKLKSVLVVCTINVKLRVKCEIFSLN